MAEAITTTPTSTQNPAPDLSAVSAQITSTLTALSAKFSEASTAITSFIASLKAPAPQPAQKGPEGGSSAGGGALAALGPEAAAAGTAITGMTGAVGGATGIATSFAGSMSSAVGMFQAAGGAIGQVSGMLTGVLGPAGAAAGQALGQVVSAVGDFINAVKPLVEAFAPGTILLFNQALENLQATVGVAFESIFQVMNDVVTKWAAYLLPVMEQFRPIIEEVSRALASLFLEGIKHGTQQIQNLMPIIKALADVVVICIAAIQPLFSLLQLFAVMLQPVAIAIGFLAKPLTQLAEMMTMAAETFSFEMDAIANVLTAFHETIKALLPSQDNGLKDQFANLQNAIRDVVKQFYVLVGTIAKFLGADQFLANLINKLEPKSGAVAAPKNATIGSLDSVAKDLATAAATASGSAQTENERSLADVVAELKNIQSGGDSKFTQVVAKLDRLIEIMGGVSSGVARQFGYDSATDALTDVFGRHPLNRARRR